MNDDQNTVVTSAEAVSTPTASATPQAPEPASETERPHRISPSQLRQDPEAIRHAFETGAYPYQNRISTKAYEKEMEDLQVELLKVQSWVKNNNERIVILFEGRDAAGKGGTIKRFMEHLNPRGARVVALGKADRARTHPMVFPALHRQPAIRRRDRVLRPLLVQPRRCRAGDGLLHAQ
jgi:polyphosphate kinase 2 (PPK2 family)